MSNSGRIGGKKHAVTSRMALQADKIALTPELGARSKTRVHRRAYVAMARKHKDMLAEVSGWAVVAHLGNAELAKSWLYTTTDVCEGNTPLEWVLMGKGSMVLKYLKDISSEQDRKIEKQCEEKTNEDRN